MNRLLEVCVADQHSIYAAALGGAHRIELCSALEADGLTPSQGLIRYARRFPSLRLHVLIRPRTGDFIYNGDELEIMRSDILSAKRLGADGVVIGALTREGDIDVDACRELIKAAGNIDVTFHRAFDHCRAPRQALEQIIALGCSRLLTSGQAATAEEGIPLLRQLVEQAAGRIIIMPGAGVTPAGARRILDATGATEIHGSLRSSHSVAGRLATDPMYVEAVVRNIR